MVAVLLIAAMVWGCISSPVSEPCRTIRYEFRDSGERMYLTTDELNSLLQTEDIYPVGRAQNHISLSRIESAVAHHPMVRHAECYMTPRYEVVISLEQRIPLLRVMTPGETYFIDTDRKVMPYRSSVQDHVLVVTGTVGAQMASTQLADFARWLQSNKYWRKRIHHVYVQSPHMIYLYQNKADDGSEQPRIVLGDMQQYERKLNKMRIFIEKGKEAVNEQHYTEYDIRFNGQVVGRK